MDEENQRPEGSKEDHLEKAMRRQRSVIIGLVAVVVIGAVAVFGYTKGWFGGKDAAQADIDENAEEFDGTVGNSPKADPQADQIAIPGYPEIYAIAGEKKVEVTLGNPEGNPCFFVYELSLNDTGEVLYTSKQIPPGEAVKDIEMSRALEAGEYEATLKLSTAHVETQDAMNGADMATTLIVQ